MADGDKKYSILIAEDDLILGEIEKLAIECNDNFCCCGVATDGQMALEIIKAEKPDIILLDQSMPVLDGIGVLERLHKKQGEEPYIVITSANASDIIMQKSFAEGADLYFPKPYNANELIKRVEMFFEHKLNQLNMATNANNLVIECGINVKTIAYGYICEAVDYVLKHYPSRPSFKEIYMAIAEKHNSDTHCVEEAINHALKSAEKRSTPKLLEMKARANISESIPNSAFIMLIANEVCHNTF